MPTGENTGLQFIIANQKLLEILLTNCVLKRLSKKCELALLHPTSTDDDTYE